ncbi:ATP-binding cassette domain-containing protein [Patescibacteria group bacterium]|nr:ATP-binding cassette domain-containing protein [Patescibacteria group bacterium]
MSKILEADNISYRDRLNSSSFELKPGFTTLMGPSGSGKTTCARLLIGDLCLSGGEIRYLDDDGAVKLTIKSESKKLRHSWRLETKQNRMIKNYVARYCGYVAQTPELPADMTIMDYIYNVRTAMGNRVDNSYITKLLDRLGILHNANKLSSEQSGGEQQRTAIAFALANKPNLLIADEPNASLDSVTSDSVLRFARSLTDQGTSILWITHTPEHQDFADHRLLAKDGEVYEL